MKRIIQFLKRNKPEILLVSLLFVLIYRAWSTLSQLTIQSDGFFFVLSESQKAFWVPSSYLFETMTLSGMILGALLPKFFGVHLSYYYLLEIFVLIVIAAIFYVMLKAITKNYFVAFSGSIISAVNYFGVYDMVSTHCYCLFLERVFPIIFLISSFLFLHLFLEMNKKKYLIFSLSLFFLGIGLGHFNLLLTPFFLLYTFFYFYFQKGKLEKRLKGLLLLLPFLLISSLFVLLHMIGEDNGVSPHKWTFTGFLLQPEKYLYFKKIALQFVYWSQYPIIFQNLSRDVLNSIIDHRVAGSYILIVLTIYGLAAVTIYKLLPKQRPMLLTTICGITIIFYLNAYLGQYDILSFSGSSRYLYIPNFLLSIFWSYFLWAVFWRKKNILYIGGFLVLGLYYFINVWLIDGNNRLAVGWSKSARSIFDHVISTRQRLSPRTLVVVTYPEFGSQEASFFTDQLGKNEVRYISDNNLINARPWEKVASSSAHVLKLHYDEKCKCVVEEKIK